MTAPLVVFDLDGTLVDTADDLIATLNRVLGEEGVRAMTREDAGALLGAGAKAMIARGFALVGEEISAERLDVLFRRFLPIYEENIAVRSRPFPGAVAALDRFEAAGWRLAVCTNKLESLSRLLLGQLGLLDRFAAICGGDTFAVKKPDGGHVLGTIERAGGEAARAVMVGDSGNDVKAAQAAGVPVVGVTFGYTDRPVASFGPDVVIDRFDELFEAVGRLRVG
ncbi:MAG: phosphoglycolate phosphatase [Hyphomicrobiales bacterium]|nr:phosphoglycolate phosphatase [Hyphomicrobiales bacterium]